MSNRAPAGALFVISAPSGTGKTTVVDRLVERLPNLVRSRSYTSRPRRPGEVDGVDYNFVSRDRFEAMVRAGEFLEWADIFGNLYGTRRQDIEDLLADGHDVVLVIDVQGARQVRERLPGRAVEIFVLPPSYEVLASRLRGRNKDPEEAIARRLATASAEVGAVEEYDYVVVNDELDRCVGEIEAIIAAERARLARRRPQIDPILATFPR
ncbi:MAG: guanylate kinase [Acidobacteriota bacterium]|jgi:guanylate kinase|nr:MAG: guanylate kinase [Acidobacteriota bacterium]